MATTSSNIHTRAKDHIFLIGHSSHQITGSKLPSNHQVLKTLFYNLRSVGLPLRNAANLTLKEVFVFWEKARIPYQLQKNAVRKLEKLYNQWRALQKSSTLKRRSFEEKTLQFTSKLPDLFDVAAEGAISKTNKQEDIQFLTHQRMRGRVGHLEGADLKITQAEKRREARKAKGKERRNREISLENIGKFLL